MTHLKSPEPVHDLPQSLMLVMIRCGVQRDAHVCTVLRKASVQVVESHLICAGLESPVWRPCESMSFELSHRADMGHAQCCERPKKIQEPRAVFSEPGQA